MLGSGQFREQVQFYEDGILFESSPPAANDLTVKDHDVRNEGWIIAFYPNLFGNFRNRAAVFESDKVLIVVW